MRITKNDIINSLYKWYSFAFSDKETFIKNVCNEIDDLGALESSRVIRKQADNYVGLQVKNGMFIELFNKLINLTDLDCALDYFNYIFEEISYTLSEKEYEGLFKIEVLNTRLNELKTIDEERRKSNERKIEIKGEEEENITDDYSVGTSYVEEDVPVDDISFIKNNLLLSIFTEYSYKESFDDIDFDDVEVVDETDSIEEEVKKEKTDKFLIKNEATKIMYDSGGSITLTKEEMDYYVIKARCHDEDAVQKLIMAHNKMLLNLAFVYSRKGPHDVSFEDLYQEGVIGLMRAIEKDDLSKGNKFTTVAMYWIRQAMERAIYNHGRIIRIPVHSHLSLGHIKAVRRRYHIEFNREPTIDEYVSETGYTKDRVKTLLELEVLPTSLDKTIGEDEDVFLGDFIPSEENNEESVIEQSEQDEHRKIVLDSLSCLTKTQALFIRKYFGLDDGVSMTSPQIADTYGVTHQCVNQTINKAIRKLKIHNGILMKGKPRNTTSDRGEVSRQKIEARKNKAITRVRLKTGRNVEIVEFDDLGENARFMCVNCGSKWVSNISVFLKPKYPKCPYCKDREKEEEIIVPIQRRGRKRKQ